MVAQLYTLEQAEEDIAALRGQIDLMTELFTQTDGTITPPTPPANSYSQYSSKGYPDCITIDGNTYQMSECRQQITPHNQSITSTSPATINNLSFTVAIGTYLVELHFVFTWGAAAGNCVFRFNGPAISEYDIQAVSHQGASPSTVNCASVQEAGSANGVGYNTSGFALTAAMTGAGPIFWVDMWCEFTFTAAGTLTATAAEGTAADPWTVDYGYMLLKPVT